MTNETRQATDTKQDFRAPSQARRIPKAVADGVGGMILPTAELSGTPEQAFRALTAPTARWLPFGMKRLSVAIRPHTAMLKYGKRFWAGWTGTWRSKQ